MPDPAPVRMQAVMREPLWKRLVVLLHAHYSRTQQLHRLHYASYEHGQNSVPTTALDCVAGEQV